MSGQETQRVVKTSRAAVVSGYVVLLDCKRTRRMEVSQTFRRAGCVVVETSHQREVMQTLDAKRQPWVLVVVDATASEAFCDGYPGTPVIHLGGDNVMRISGRITMHDAPGLGADVHGLASTRGGVS